VSAWKKVDLPTLARPTYVEVSEGRKGCADNALLSCTYDPTLEIVTGSAQKKLLLFHCLLWRHLPLGAAGVESDKVDAT